MYNYLHFPTNEESRQRIIQLGEDPETIDQTGMNEVKDLVGILSGLPLEVIVTKANSDLGGEEIKRYLDEVDKLYDNIHVYASLGRVRYLSLMKYAKCVVGNSSSGIIETPAMHIRNY